MDIIRTPFVLELFCIQVQHRMADIRIQGRVYHILLRANDLVSLGEKKNISYCTKKKRKKDKKEKDKKRNF